VLDQARREAAANSVRGGESPQQGTHRRKIDAYLMHGDLPDASVRKSRIRERRGRAIARAQIGADTIVRDTEREAQDELGASPMFQQSARDTRTTNNGLPTN